MLNLISGLYQWVYVNFANPTQVFDQCGKLNLMVVLVRVSLLKVLIYKEGRIN